jgi:hypothetical protein
VVRIRYADLPGGLHVRAVTRGRDTIIYLLPGLTVMQRRDALRRARSSSRVGQGPRLPAAGVTGAVMADAIRNTVRNTAAAIRGHPAIFIPQIVIVVLAAIAYVLLVSVSGQAHSPQADPSALGDSAAGAAAPPPGGRSIRPALLISPPSPSPKPTPSRPRTTGVTPPTPPSPAPKPTPTATPTPTPTPSPTPTRRPAPLPTPSPGPPVPTPVFVPAGG